MSKPVLEFLAWIGLLQKENIDEHKHYWTRKEIYELAKKNRIQSNKIQKIPTRIQPIRIIKENNQKHISL